MLSRVVRLTALSLPLLLAGVLVCSGGWRVHGGQVERVGSVGGGSSQLPANGVPQTMPSAMPGRSDFVGQLTPSVPWPVWAGLILLCLLPGVASVHAWSGSRRTRRATFSAGAAAP